MSMTTELLLATPDAAGYGLLLQPGDRLVAVNGTPFLGAEGDLADRFAKAGGKPQALTFARGEETFTLLAETAKLGTWSEVPPLLPAFAGERLNPDVLTNWEILADRSDVYDLHPLRSSVLALIAPPIWMLQMRLWVPGSALIAAAMVAAAVSVLMLLAVYLTAGLHLWYSGSRYFRKDRMARGFSPRFILAAPSERAAHQAYLKLRPGARFIFSTAEHPVPEQAG